MKRPSDAGPRSRRAARGQAARKSGRWAEMLCAASLSLRGWRVLERGFITGRGSGAGEIDIVARRGSLLAFVEVKARPDLGDAGAAISSTQRERLVRAAAAYVARRPEFGHCQIRFDAMLVAPWRWPLHIKDAWREGG